LIPVELELVTAAPRQLWPKALGPVSNWRSDPCDVGVLQASEMQVDRKSTIASLADWYGDYRDKVSAEADLLGATVDLVYGDVPPLAFSAAAVAALPSVAVANFSWDWIYREMGLEVYAEIAAEAYSHCKLLLELDPAAPMPAFSVKQQPGLLGCRSELDRAGLASMLGVDENCTLVLVSLRDGIENKVGLPPATDGVVYLASYQLVERHDFSLIPPSLAHRDVISACDVVVTKPGCGIIGDCFANSTRMLYAVPSGFPEHRVLSDWLQARPGSLEIDPVMLADGTWGDQLQELLAQSAPAVLRADADRNAAQAIKALLETGRG